MKLNKRLMLPSALILAVLLPVAGVWAFFANVDYSASNQAGSLTPKTSQPDGLHPVDIRDSSFEEPPEQPEQSIGTQTPYTYTSAEQTSYPEMSAGDKAYLEKLEKERAELKEQQRLSKCAQLIESYPIYVNQAEAQHQQRLDSIGTDYRSRGMGYSGAYQAAVAEENARHQQNLSSLQDQQNAKLAQNSC